MTSSDLFIIVSGFCGLGFALFNLAVISSKSQKDKDETVALEGGTSVGLGKIPDIQQKIEVGAKAFLRAEYGICCVFLLCFAVVIFTLTAVSGAGVKIAACTTISFLLGASTSMLSGYVGMMVAVYANGRTTMAAAKESSSRLTGAFTVAFRAGAVMGHALCSFGVLVLMVLLLIYRDFVVDDWQDLAACVAGFGLGGSSLAMFGRVGGGIYTKAADVGADLVGKVIHGLEEDDPKNPATIADNVGDNVGDVAGMGADLFGSFAEATCAALVLGTASPGIMEAGWAAVTFPVALSAGGILVCIVCAFLATDVKPVVGFSDVEPALKLQLISTTVLSVFYILGLAKVMLPDSFEVSTVSSDEPKTVTWFGAAFCSVVGTVAGLVIGLVTEFYTSHSFEPVKECARACKRGAAVNVIYGLALGYKSAIIPVFALAAVIYVAFTIADLYGIALAALGMLVTLATGLTIDGYGPVTDNAGGIAEMAQLPETVREKTDCLDAAGNTTAAIGKGYCIGSAALVSLALYGAFVVRVGHGATVNVLEPLTFASILIGANLPYWFSAMTMKSVGLAAAEMVKEVQRQFQANPKLLDPTSDAEPDYDACILISTQASLREMMAPAALVMLAPLVAGTFFGVNAVFGLLTGGLVSGVQLAVSMSNSGGAWDNAKKYISGGFDADTELRKKDDQGRSTPVHDAAVTGDTIGDPFKDTSGPALNILMKLMAILSLVFAPYFLAINDGKGLLNL
mmetsp:Transcript_11614/g.38182  ORF Transcript_11614/g.38182 Transcript_11614/m.38182 type:complete len:740 (+) Transcript_11614:113-2332(+)|eukprot:CAMPEP_0118895900 /NCGR_PEP_ID=MMETSP1166-20130328/4033_1 /TAXON_ID=1104430 /ORGANISM="Chrysoreinhardia sp, Strain CCMP3193" /LENGTH=739 /DNA_ID=CAMNT_0006834951 /DNA_START=54 /DNA_END=2273 /DNA_ORIENTATION=-